MKVKIKARAHLLGNLISTEMILPSKYIDGVDKIKLSEHAFSESNKNLVGQIKNGDILIAGANFGVCNHACPHHALEMTVACLKELGIACIVASSFSRLFYRAAINQGLMLLESKDACRMVNSQEEIILDIQKGEISCKEGPIAVSVLSESVGRIIEAGGLIQYAKRAVSKI
jgi:3-isopropylmalate/(R)-2-methylmalate dehydratase small subunit